jgi:hypothetical protein
MTHQLGSASYFLSPCPGRRVAVNELPSHRPLPNGRRLAAGDSYSRERSEQHQLTVGYNDLLGQDRYRPGT